MKTKPKKQIPRGKWLEFSKVKPADKRPYPIITESVPYVWTVGWYDPKTKLFEDVIYHTELKALWWINMPKAPKGIIPREFL